VQENKFPGQEKLLEKVYVFKMSEVGHGSGVDLVRRMQPHGDLQDVWVMFDHVKHVKGWTTMACHVYDSAYCGVMIIAVCDMQYEDVTAQSLLWHGLNLVMADSAQTNWNAVRIIYGSGDPKVPMESRKRTCLLHWTVSMERHTATHIKPDLQQRHKLLCKQYKDAKAPEQSESRYLAIQAWWLSSRAASEEGIKDLDTWLAF
jgi:hypothetical protein